MNPAILDTILIVVGSLLLIFGIIGCVLPVIPGPPISFIGYVVLVFSSFYQEGYYTSYIVAFILAVGVTVLDYIVPAWGTKKFGGSKKGVIGSIIGLVVGILVISPILSIFLNVLGVLIGIIAGPFLGAYVGELIEGQDKDSALRAAFGSFLGFVAGTIMKLAVSIIIIGMFLREIFHTFPA